METIMKNNHQDGQESKMQLDKFRLSHASKDSVIVGTAVILVFILSFYFNVFRFIVTSFRKNIIALEWIDEIIMCLLTLSIGLAVFAWRRLKECKKETEKCIVAEKELANMANTRAEAERIISKQLHAEIEVLLKYLKEERR